MKTDETKLIHIPHLEDLVLQDGESGIKSTIKILESIVPDIKKSIVPKNMTMKWDGSPSLVFHKSKRDYWVATKSAFNKTPKLNRTHTDINVNHGYETQLSKYLHYALSYCKTIDIEGTYQCEFLYIDSDLDIDTNEVHFQPNTLRYSIPLDSLAGKRIIKSKMGIIIHSRYDENMVLVESGTYSTSDIPENEHIYIDDAFIKTYKDITDYPFFGSTVEVIESNMRDVSRFSKNINPLFVNNVYSSPLYKHLDRFTNYVMRTKGLQNPDQVIKNLIKFVSEYYNRESDKLKTVMGKSRKEKECTEIMNHILTHHGDIKSMYRYMFSVAQLKNTIVNILDYIITTKQVYVNKGSIVTCGAEGYVYSDHIPVKFVNRFVFSEINEAVRKSV